MTYYDEISEGYDGLYREEQLKKAGVIIGWVHPKENELLLDVGCGPAPYFCLFSCVKVGIDPSLELMKNAEEGIFIQAVAEHLPFQDKSFDYVISLTAIHNFTDPMKGLEEIRRVAKKTVVITVLKVSKRFDSIEKGIMRLFKVNKIILEEKDVIFFLQVP